MIREWQSRPIGLELDLCQRYYEKSYPTDTAPGTNYNNILLSYELFQFGTANTTLILTSSNFRVTKRSDPTMTVYSNNGTAGNLSYFNGSWSLGGTAASDLQANENGMWTYTAGALSALAYDWSASAEL